MRHAPIRSGSLRRASIVLASVAGLLLATGSVASAAPLLQLYVHDTCVTSHNNVVNGHMHVIQQRGATDIATVDYDTNSYTDFVLCGFEPIEKGDVFHVNETGIDPEIHFNVTVPEFTAVLNPSTNKQSGHVPTPGSLVNVAAYPVITLIRSFGIASGLLADSGGDYVHDWTGQLSLAPGVVGTTMWEDSRPNRFFLEVAAPSVLVEAGKSTVSVTGAYGTSNVVRLRSGPGKPVRGSATPKITNYMLTAGATFKLGSKTVRALPGDLVFSSKIRGSYRVRASDVVVKKPGNGTLTATCAPGSIYTIVYNRSGLPVHGKAGTGGKISNNNVTNGNGPVVPSSVIDLICRLPSGFGQKFTVTVK